MNSSYKSAKVTKVITIILCAALGLLMVGCYPLLKWYFGEGNSQRLLGMVISFYVCSPAAWVALFSIMGLMNNVLNDTVFSESSVKLLRILSICCCFVSVVCLVGCFFSNALAIFGCGALFMALILLVLKNVMRRACEIKEENDMTI